MQTHREGRRTPCRRLCICVLLAFAAGCVPSLHPLYFDHQLFIEHRLLGTWADEDTPAEGDYWQFEARDAASYLIQAKMDKPFRAIGRTFSIEGQLYLDLTLDTDHMEKMIEASGYTEFHFLATHTFWRVDLSHERLVMNTLNPDWLKKAIEEKVVRIPHTILDNTVVLTADTGELQRLVVQCLAYPEAWTDTMNFGRVHWKAPAPPAEAQTAG